mmetsp:Transcript_20510/g.32708  ORF Transcript_20510/g.32708 Transcript_20510/m.32708 type:complete len:212 (+) Transcript_20510:750-1385(+)
MPPRGESCKGFLEVREIVSKGTQHHTERALLPFQIHETAEEGRHNQVQRLRCGAVSRKHELVDRRTSPRQAGHQAVKLRLEDLSLLCGDEATAFRPQGLIELLQIPGYPWRWILYAISDQRRWTGHASGVVKAAPIVPAELTLSAFLNISSLGKLDTQSNIWSSTSRRIGDENCRVHIKVQHQLPQTTGPTHHPLEAPRRGETNTTTTTAL